MSRISGKLLRKWQRLLAERYSRQFSLEETEEIADALVIFFDVLGSASRGDKGRGDGA